MPVTDAPLDLVTDLVRIPSFDATGEGEGQVAERLASSLGAAGLQTDILVSPAGRPSLVAVLPGPTDRPALTLLSHTDVVPVEEASWSRDPFGGEVHDGMLWGRGTLDMKGIAVMHAVAAAALARSGATPTREVRVVAVADEERGGTEGAGWLVAERPETLGFRDGAPPPEALGEGAFGLSGVLDTPIMPIVVGEKGPLTVKATATAAPGHGALPSDDQAIRAVARYVEAAAGFRAPRIHPVMRAQFQTLSRVAGGATGRLFAVLAGPGGPAAVRAFAPVLRRKAGAIGFLVSDSITPTWLEGGYAFNVVPGEASAVFDCRLLPDADPDEVLAELVALGERHGVEVTELARSSSPVSPYSPLFDVLQAASAELPDVGVTVPSLTPGTTDLRYLRAAGATAYAWVPLVLTPELLATFHGHDERVPVEAFERGVQAMTEVVRIAST
jgi:acetylornithine deacetylase/succinyl-diaminopimelate desuccinylase-like protein